MTRKQELEQELQYMQERLDEVIAEVDAIYHREDDEMDELPAYEIEIARLYIDIELVEEELLQLKQGKL